MEHQHKSHSGKIHKQPYSRERIEELKFMIADFQQQGNPKRYSILVNGELVVGTNSEAENFDNYLPFIKPYTETVEVRLYFKESPNSNRYIFDLKPEATELDGVRTQIAPQDTALNLENRIVQALERQRLENQVELLHTENKRLKRKLRKTKERVVESPGIDMKELLSHGLQLYGQMNGKSVPTPVQGVPSTEVEIEMEQTEADKFFEYLKDKYSEKELQQALKTWELFVKHPELRADFQELITSKK